MRRVVNGKVLQRLSRRVQQQQQSGVALRAVVQPPRTIPSSSLWSAQQVMRFSAATTSSEDDDATEDVAIAKEDEQQEDAALAETEDEDLGRKLKPKEVVEQLNKYIVGQPDAKRAVAIALRNRWRRQKIPDDLRTEVSPKNILMIGPTGCGKTEIARRLAKLSEAPFVKVEATKFTEVGFHGKDVDQIIRDLVENAINMVKKQRKERVRREVQHLVENRILDALTGANVTERSRASFERLLRLGEMEDRTITVDVPVTNKNNGGPISFVAGEKSLPIGEIFSKAYGEKKSERKVMTVAESRAVFEELEMEKAIDMSDVVREAISETEENGIVFIDEIDKICSNGDFRRQADPSSEGVQRDLLPLIEGSVISTKHGNVNTDHILFVASGAFHSAKPSDLLAELQGRLPIRVELKGLTESDLYRILTEPVTNLIKQQIELIKTEDVHLEFTEEAVREIARVASEINKTIENIGARRLHTVLEKVVEDISFDSSDMAPGSTVTITKDFVTERVGKLLQKTDLSKFIL
jgi:ATP-dependent HslUV protease ATP-binding subunit HslU|uniref:AAA+ ATPase domain-containing protein n=1 Tax=Globisporangium ultimum (strain ATCC 200006 / CBS 805.95 / DAOM BR144) TaxID=431595 RepID=K3WIF2_GLOUD